MGNGKGGGGKVKKSSLHTHNAHFPLCSTRRKHPPPPSLIFFEIWDMVLSNSTAPSPLVFDKVP